MSHERGVRKFKTGKVLSNKMDRTAVVLIERVMRHPVYSKVITRKKRVYAHDPDNSAQEGQTVRIVECRPLSRLKKWRIVEEKSQ